MLSSKSTPACIRRFFALTFVVALMTPSLLPAQFGAAGTQFLDQDSPAVPDSNDPNDQFAEALAAGDFEGDGYPDLVVHTSRETVSGVINTGQITVIRGSELGLDPVLGAELWNEGQGLLTGEPDSNDYFGYSVAAGDFNDDQIEDLAIAVYGGDPVIDGQPVLNAGEVYVLWGSGTGLTHQGHLTIRQGTFGLPGEPVPGNRFGSTLTSGDFNGDGVDDLALGSETCDFEPPEGPIVQGAGCLAVLYGSNSGLDASPGEGVPGVMFDLSSFGWAPGPFDGFGNALAAADFDGNGFEDLAVAAHGREVAGENNAGAVFIFWGSEDGLTAIDVQKIHRGTPGISGSPTEDDNLGDALEAADFDGDGAAELVIGVPQATLLLEEEGMAYVVPGVPGDALDTNATTSLTQGVLTGKPLELTARFGSQAMAGDFDGDGYPDLAISAPLANAEGVANAGLTWIVRGHPNGLQIENALEISHADVALGALPNDSFGLQLLSADFDANGADDLVVGMPIFGADDAGALDVFYGASTVGPPEIFLDDFESGNFDGWSSVVNN
ncbi:MAG: hypothetical protein AAF560_30375 [Acidobacteriota bacterium]